MLTRRPLIALVAALALWVASLKAYLTGAIDLSTAGIRFLVAFAVAWVGVTVLGTVVAGYGKQEPTESSPRRRSSDLAGVAGVANFDTVDDLPDLVEASGERIGVDDG